MNRDEILAKSRAEKEDEGMQHEERRAEGWSLRAILLIAAVVIFYDIYRGQTNHAVYAITWANIAISYFSRYRFTKKKSELLIPVIATFSCILSLLNYFLGW